jgi:hypothetical protein
VGTARRDVQWSTFALRAAVLSAFGRPGGAQFPGRCA